MLKVQGKKREAFMIGIKYSAGCWLLLGVLAAQCQAQFPNRGQNDPSEEAFPIAPRPLMRLLREGEIAFKEERWSDGITA